MVRVRGAAHGNGFWDVQVRLQQEGTYIITVRYFYIITVKKNMNIMHLQYSYFPKDKFVSSYELCN